jgi:hypothetical protein
MGKFLQETLENTSLERSKKDGPSLVEEFSNFLSKVRLFQKHVVHTKLDIYVFILSYNKPLTGN